jgi:hypothetical protein
MNDLGAFSNVLLVDFDPQTWSLGNGYPAVLICKDTADCHTVKQIVLRVVDTQALLLDKSVVTDRI